MISTIGEMFEKCRQFLLPGSQLRFLGMGNYKLLERNAKAMNSFW